MPVENDVSWAETKKNSVFFERISVNVNILYSVLLIFGNFKCPDSFFPGRNWAKRESTTHHPPPTIFHPPTLQLTLNILRPTNFFFTRPTTHRPPPTTHHIVWREGDLGSQFLPGFFLSPSQFWNGRYSGFKFPPGYF